MTVVACLKWVSVTGDAHDAGVSAADHAALECALRLAAATGKTVTVVSAGGRGADAALRDALAVGADRAVRVDLDPDAPSRVVAAALAAVADGADFVLCGDYSPDRGSGSVPAFLAAELAAAQALGLVGLDHEPVDGAVAAVRRLDGGRRERLLVSAPAVLSVEGSVARLRRAGLSAALAARHAAVEVAAGSSTEPVEMAAAAIVRPYRPRPRVLPPPSGETALDRVRALTDAGATAVHGDTVILEPAAAAAHIVDSLRAWGYLDPPS